MTPAPPVAPHRRLGRNDPCPSGAGVKIKKCLLQHPDLSLHSTPAAVWWICNRWQAPLPSALELLSTLPAVGRATAEKLELVERILFEAPADSVPWEAVLRDLAKAGHPDVCALFHRIVDRADKTNRDEVWRICETAVALADDGCPDLLAPVTALYCADAYADADLGPPAIGQLREALQTHGQPSRIEELRARFPEWVALSDPLPPEPRAEPWTPKEPKPQERSPDERRADEIWHSFERIEKPSVGELDALIGDLLSLPSSLTEWSEVLGLVRRREHPDFVGVYRRIAREIVADDNSVAFLHWSAAENSLNRGQTSLLPEIAGNFGRLDAKTYDPDALDHLMVYLMFHGFNRAAIELAERFLPIIDQDEAVVSNCASDTAWKIFELRMAERIASPGLEPLEAEALAIDLQRGVDGWVNLETARHAATVLLAAPTDPVWSCDDFRAWAPHKASEAEQQRVGLAFLGTKIRFVREASHLDQLPPSLTWLGLEGAWRMQTSELQSKKGSSGNLLDALDAAKLEARVADACWGIVGVQEQRAVAMIRTIGALARFATRRGLTPADQTAALEKQTAQLLGKLRAPL